MTQHRRGGKKRKILAGASGLGLLAVVAAYFLGSTLGLPFGSGSGGGEENDRDNPSHRQDSPAALSAEQLNRPMVVEVSEHDYVILQRRVNLPRVLELAGQVPPGDGPAVEVRLRGDSRAKAENDLKEALDAADVRYSWQGPLTP
jgi:hypothetical protein